MLSCLAQAEQPSTKLPSITGPPSRITSDTGCHLRPGLSLAVKPLTPRQPSKSCLPLFRRSERQGNKWSRGVAWRNPWRRCQVTQVFRGACQERRFVEVAVQVKDGVGKLIGEGGTGQEQSFGEAACVVLEPWIPTMWSRWATAMVGAGFRYRASLLEVLI